MNVLYKKKKRKVLIMSTMFFPAHKRRVLDNVSEDGPVVRTRFDLHKTTKS